MRSHRHERARALIERASLVAARAVAITIAPLLMITGLGMSMSVVLLPFGVFFGVGGVLLCVWGLFGASAPAPSTRRVGSQPVPALTR